MKIAIVGYSGAGKSTLAEKLGQAYGAPVLHLDTVYWAPGWKTRDSRGQLEAVSSFLNSHDDWVIDGNYSKLYYDRRMREADRIVLLLFNRFRCLYRVMKRCRACKGAARSDPAEGCPEKLDWEFVRWVLRDGRTKEKRAHYRNIQKRFPGKTVVLKSQRQVDRYLAKFS